LVSIFIKLIEFATSSQIWSVIGFAELNWQGFKYRRGYSIPCCENVNKSLSVVMNCNFKRNVRKLTILSFSLPALCFINLTKRSYLVELVIMECSGKNELCGAVPVSRVVIKANLNTKKLEEKKDYRMPIKTV
jgi:hypothetical protein